MLNINRQNICLLVLLVNWDSGVMQKKKTPKKQLGRFKSVTRVVFVWYHLRLAAAEIVREKKGRRDCQNANALMQTLCEGKHERRGCISFPPLFPDSKLLLQLSRSRFIFMDSIWMFQSFLCHTEVRLQCQVPILFNKSALFADLAQSFFFFCCCQIRHGLMLFVYLFVIYRFLNSGELGLFVCSALE